MLFNEYYGEYFASVAEIVSEAVAGTLTQDRITDIACRTGFAESVLTIPANLKSGAWPLITPDCKTPIRHTPPHPLTLLQKRWMKSLLLDPRIRLFNVSMDGLEDVEPLFTPDMIVYYDRYSDGDPFEDEGYIARFRILLEAVRTHRNVEVTFESHRGFHNEWVVIPYRLEYSATDDKFRLLCTSVKWNNRTLNLGRITKVRLKGPYDPEHHPAPDLKNETVTLEIRNERNALERAMLQFSYLAKRTEKIDDSTYEMTLQYRPEDETELLIKILSFGPMMKVLQPQSFADLIVMRINKQFRRKGTI